ncbi:MULTISPECIES: NADPH-dependent F420 reductase [Sphingobacterium]|uniref:NADPH-dependent F420 reductase n=1 Tax=Sphingobacterium TaxID=28453 RepID=UPI00257FC89F|nr:MULTISPECIES: NAD(P)-binding domain-containing protein [Sphingobacterium]
MKIGIIGAGSIGETLAEKLSKKGHQIFIANSRGPHTISFADNDAIKAVDLKAAVKDVDVVIISIPFGRVAELSKDLFSELDEDVPVIETMNYFPHRDGIIEEIENGKPHSVWVSEQIGRPVVKAFNNIVTHSFRKYGQPSGTPGRIALTVSSDNENWKKVAFQLIDETGFDSFDAGSLANSWRQQPGSPPYCTDLTADEMAGAILRSDKKQTIINRDVSNEKIAELGEEYMHIVVTTNYPENFDDKAINIYRSVNGIPLK